MNNTGYTLKQADTVKGSKYSFEVHLANGTKKPDLKRSFLKVAWILAPQLSNELTHLTLEDGTKWELYVEPEVDEILWMKDRVECIISYQVFHSGECIAVARRYSKEKVRKERQCS